MTKLLYIQASPQEERSFSLQLANAFLRAYRENHNDLEVAELDLFRTHLPEFGKAASEGKYALMHQVETPEAGRQAWSEVETVIGTFSSPDEYLLAVPMWNFSIPYRLKHLIDIVVQPSYTFTVTEDGYEGLLRGKRAFIMYASGGSYSAPEAAAMDMQKNYMRNILNFMGITEIHTVTVAPTLMAGPDAAEQNLRKAVAEAEKLAAEL